MFRRTLVVIAAVLLVGSLSSAPSQAADTWVPPGGAAFNNPVAGYTGRTALVRRVIAAVDHSPRGSVIRIAAYSFDRKDVADALVRAHRRGVLVQMVLNDNWTSTQTRRLRKILGGNPSASRFVRICDGSCRGGAGNLHMKVYAFSRTGAATNVIMTGSANMTDRAVQLQWNDMVTLRGQNGLFNTFVGVFNQLKYDRPVSPQWVYYEQPDMQAQFYRTSARQRTGTTTSRTPTPDEDPVMKRLRAVNCVAQPGFGLNGKTQIRVMMYGWNGDRGKYLADQVARLKRQGCGIKVITSVAGGGVIKVLNEAGIPVKSADYKYLSDGTVDFYSHLKVMWIDGTMRKPVTTTTTPEPTLTDPSPAPTTTTTIQNVGTRMVWTGSENWSEMSFRNDELCLGLTNSTIVRKYKSEFDYLWTNYSHRVGLRPLNKPRYVG
ncbi:phospholipase D-like domain-containing protein [Nocardioides cavernaquae]|uniref:phospholipase D-like domain-containing protein n=1 Tax=Nocardioides cavernaquae TaxID=2321396 RepID=UPI00160263D9|nr:phospholipase D-like domain-containing protein [Nocardioides cavernaquae]